MCYFAAFTADPEEGGCDFGGGGGESRGLRNVWGVDGEAGGVSSECDAADVAVGRWEQHGREC